MVDDENRTQTKSSPIYETGDAREGGDGGTSAASRRWNGDDGLGKGGGMGGLGMPVLHNVRKSPKPPFPPASTQPPSLYITPTSTQPPLRQAPKPPLLRPHARPPERRRQHRRRPSRPRASMTLAWPRELGIGFPATVRLSGATRLAPRPGSAPARLRSHPSEARGLLREMTRLSP